MKPKHQHIRFQLQEESLLLFSSILETNERNQSTMNNLEIIQTLASTHPDFSNFQTRLHDLSKTELPAELLEQTLTLLEKDPEQAAAINAMRNNPATTKSFMTGGDVAIFIAVAFLLRTHIRLERETDEYGDGKWKFLLEHKSGDSKLITELFKKLEAWIGNKL